MISNHGFLIWAVFNMLSDCNRVKTFPPGFLNSYSRPYRTIRQYRMDMEVTFQSLITVESRNIDVIPIAGIVVLYKLMDMFI